MRLGVPVRDGHELPPGEGRALVLITAVVGGAMALAGMVLAPLSATYGGLLAVAGLMVVAGGVVVSGQQAGWLVCAGAVMVSGWDGVTAGPVNLPDLGVVLAVFAAACGLARSIRLPRPPNALLLAVGLFSLSFVLVLVFPPDPLYIAGRIRPGEVIDLGPAGRVQPSTIGNFLRLLIALLVVPLVVTVFVRTRREAVGMARAFVLGALVNAAFSLLDKFGVTSVSEELRGFADVEGRQAGLTTHPNQLGLVLAMALPLAFFVFRRRPAQLAVVAVLLGGIWLSGSRAALAAGLLALGLSLIIAGWRLRLAYGAMAGAVVLAASDVLTFTRFGAASQSDKARSEIAVQAVRDFVHSPVWGIGADVLQDAHVIYLQLLAASGVLGFLGFALVIAWALRNAVRLRANPVFAAAGASMGVFLVAGIASNALLARYIYIPLGLIWAGTLLAGCKDGEVERLFSSGDGRRERHRPGGHLRAGRGGRAGRDGRPQRVAAGVGGRAVRLQRAPGDH